MTKFQKITPEEITRNPFTLIGKDWLLVTAEKDGRANTMTASWGGLGVLWGKPVAFIFIRPQRYTKEFLEAGDRFSLSILDETHRRTLSYLGSVSGRDEDKIKKSGLTLAHEPHHVFRAMMEGIGFGTRAILDAFAAGGYASTEMTVGGGATASATAARMRSITSL